MVGTNDTGCLNLCSTLPICIAKDFAHPVVVFLRRVMVVCSAGYTESHMIYIDDDEITA